MTENKCITEPNGGNCLQFIYSSFFVALALIAFFIACGVAAAAGFFIAFFALAAAGFFINFFALAVIAVFIVFGPIGATCGNGNAHAIRA